LSAHCCVEQKQGCGLFPGINGWWHLANWYASYNEQPHIRFSIRCNHNILCGPLFKITRHSDWEGWCHPLLVLRFSSSHGLAVTEYLYHRYPRICSFSAKIQLYSLYMTYHRIVSMDNTFLLTIVFSLFAGHTIACFSSSYGFRLPLWYLKTIHRSQLCTFWKKGLNRYGQQPFGIYYRMVVIIVVCPPWIRTVISNVIYHGLALCVLWAKMIGDCSFCWYWWTCCPYLFKPFFQNVHNWDLWIVLRYQRGNRKP
jgi:type IV secretory pathway VirB3-like protein